MAFDCSARTGMQGTNLCNFRSMQFKDKVVFITGASRGIGKAIGLALAAEGASILVTGKTTEPHPKLPGTIKSAADEMRAAGGDALAVKMDIRFEDQIEAAIDQCVNHFGGVDILINNASAISLTGIAHTPVKRYDLMHQVNVRGTFIATQKCLPYLIKSENPHILNLSPPLNMSAHWFSGHLAYTMTKYGMSMCVLGLAEELRDHGVAVNALWPQTAIATAAVQNLLGGDALIRQSRKASIVADAAKVILAKSSRAFTGQFCIDEHILRETGVSDFDQYAVEPGGQLMRDFFLD